MLSHAWIIPLFPAASFVLILFFGKRMPKKGAEIGIAAVAIAFALAIVVDVQWIQRVNDHHGPTETSALVTHAAPGEQAASGVKTVRAEEGGGHEATTSAVVSHATWLENAGKKFTVGSMVDGLTAIMLFVVGLVSLLVHIYATDYVHGDRRYTHFFAFLSLFTASMMALVMAENTLQLIVSWELVGLCSFALIGHWWEEKPNSDAALKAFLVNRVGDVGLLTGMITLFFAAGGTFSIITINTKAATGQIDHLLLLVAASALVAAVMSKSGQFILHVWLPDAMAGPTPVSALIHAATMVVAGIFMVARMYSVFWEGLQIGNSNINLLALVGGVTVVFGALLAFVQNDIKKVLAYSTVSQLGYMAMALGMGAWTAAIFHLFTHAFFKACLFLGAGSVSHSVHSFDMKKDMGGLRKFMPQTFATFVIASLALAGIFPLAGFWSKDEILAGAGQLGGGGNGYPLMLVFGVIGALMTAAYMGRCIWYTFYGEFRGHGHPHESGPRITIPLWILAGLAAIAGFANFPWGTDGIKLRFEHYVQPTAAYFPHITAVEFSFTTAIVSTAVAVGGLLLAYLWYWRDLGPHGITERNRLARGGLVLLENKYYFDWLYIDVITRAIKRPIARGAYWINQNVIDGAVNLVGITARESGKFVYDKIDQGVIDGAVNGSGFTAEGSGQLLRRLQTGKVQQYAALLFAGTAILAGVLVVVIQ